MKVRQFVQLASVKTDQRDELLVEGLAMIAASLAIMNDEIAACDAAGANRAGRLLRNVGREEAGKYLLLLDLYRTADESQATVTKQLRRASNHMAKLLYAQMADYSIADRAEMVRAIDTHRRELYLDGPNDFDFIMPNDLIAEREGTLYVDLVEAEGNLEWWGPATEAWPSVPCRSMLLVAAIARTGLVSREGLVELRKAWALFDHGNNSRHDEWADRSSQALTPLVPSEEVPDDEWLAAARRVLEWWPMPLVHIDLSLDKVSEVELTATREQLEQEWLEREFGPFGEDGW